MRALTGLISLLAMAAVATPALAQPQARFEPYSFRLRDNNELAVERGRMLVPEDRDDPRSRRIELGFLRFRSTAARPGNPIVYLAGGPGGSGVFTAQGRRQPIFLALRAVADVIVFDQRGTGLSNHIPPCTAERRLDPAAGLNEAALTAYHAETLRTCVGRWRAAGVAVNGYTTVQSADDIEDLRRALGARQVDLWGISYGTHLGMAMMRRHPRSVGRVAFASVEGMSQTVKLPAHVDATYARIDRAVGGGLVERMRRVHAQLDAAPLTLTAGPPDARISFRMDSFAARRMAGGMMADPAGYAQVAGAYAALDAGRGEAIAQPLYDFFYREPVSMGMGELMDVASGISDARQALIARQAPASLLGLSVNFPMPQLRGAVPGLDLGDAFRREIRSNHPVLILEGDLDVRTPLEEQAVATRGLSRAHRILVRNGGHNLFEAHPDVPGILVAFFSGRPVTVRELRLPVPSAGAE
ncbi:MAG TPA: alpha/beta hydrolase [Allosphingosinicella sp.]|nr:alpha/beta hydrolase [Allosphingosinicella sp.]